MAKLSGAARRKIAREKATAEAAAKGSDYIPPMPALGKLETVTDYRRELNVVYRRMRQGQMPPEVATKSAFILNLGAALAKAETELAEYRALLEGVERAEQGQLRQVVAEAHVGSAIRGELLPREIDGGGQE